MFGWISARVALDDVAPVASSAMEVVLELATKVACEPEVSVSLVGVAALVLGEVLVSDKVVPYVGAGAGLTRR